MVEGYDPSDLDAHTEPPLCGICKKKHFSDEGCRIGSPTSDETFYKEVVKPKLDELRGNNPTVPDAYVKLPYYGGVYPAETPEDVNSAFPPKSLADQKAEEAAQAIEPLNRMEQICVAAAKANWNLLQGCFTGVGEVIEEVFGESFIPHGDPAQMMKSIDEAKNLLTVAQVYFDAMCIPVMQSASIAQELLVNPVKEPSAEERGRRVFEDGQMVYHAVYGPSSVGRVMEYDPHDDDYLVKWEPSGRATWCEAQQLVKIG